MSILDCRANAAHSHIMRGIFTRLFLISELIGLLASRKSKIDGSGNDTERVDKNNDPKDGENLPKI